MKNTENNPARGSELDIHYQRTGIDVDKLLDIATLEHSRQRAKNMERQQYIDEYKSGLMKGVH